MKKVVWICGIYPNSRDPFLGDFIQRHAEAAAAYLDITLIHVCFNDNNLQSEHTSAQSTLRVDMISLPRRDYLTRQFLFVRAYMQWFENYIKLNGKPSVVHVHYSLQAAFIARLIKIRFGVSYVITEHSSMFLPVSNEWAKSKPVLRLTTKIGIRGAMALSTVSKTLADGMRNLLNVHVSNIIPNVVDTSLFYFQHVPDRAPHFIHNTGPEQVKNSFRILGAIAAQHVELRQAGFKLYIFGAYREDIDRQAKQLEISDIIEQQGEVSQSTLASYIRTSAGLIQYSSYETFGCVVAEALAAGSPVIVSDIPAMRELVNDKSGLVCNFDQKVLENAIRQMTTTYNQYNREQISTAAAAQFSYDVVGKKFVQWYEKLGI